MRSIFLRTLLLMIMPITLYGQTIIKGKILTDSGQPAKNASVESLESKELITADSNGEFSINAKEGETLYIYADDAEDLTVKATTNFMTIQLKKAKVTQLGEVVAIGYGTQKKIDVTGSVGFVKGDDLVNKPNGNAVSSIQGKVSGVQVNNSSAPGTAPKVLIRGVSSINGNVKYIVDGVFMDDISTINPSDIESMSVLKDASSLAIYGMQAANGAILVTTKRGKGKKPTFNFNSYAGIKKAVNIPKMVNGNQYIELYNEKLTNMGATSGFITKAQYPESTDWFDNVLKDGFINSNDVSVTGTSDKLTYFLSMGYLIDNGILNAGKNINSGNDYKRFSSRVNVSYELNDHLKVGTNFAWINGKTNNVKNPFSAAWQSPPIYLPFDSNIDNYGYSPTVNVNNPRAVLDLFRGKSTSDQYLLNLWGEYKFWDNFTFRISYSKDRTAYDDFAYTPKITYTPTVALSSLGKTYSKTDNYVLDNTLRWEKRLGDHDITAMVGFSQRQDLYTYQTGTVNNIDYRGKDSELYLQNGDKTTLVIADGGNKIRQQGYFARINYAYAGKYLLNASIRRDGTSNFSEDSRFDWFPSVGLGWVVSKENFLKNSKNLNLLKLKGSWGRLGNSQVENMVYKNSITQEGVYFGGIGYPAHTITEMVDPSIKWEIVEELDLGFELAMFQNKFSLEATYFDKKTKDVVALVGIPTTAGDEDSNFYTNAYDFQNKGVETSFQWKDKINDKVGYSIYGNITFLDNSITNVFGGTYLETSPGLFGNPIIRLQKGVQVGSYYGFVVDGIFQDAAEVAAAPQQSGAVAGGFKFKDINGDGVIDAQDKTFLGSPIPNYTYGFGFNLDFYGFDLGVDFQGVQGNQIYNYNRNNRFGNESWDLDFYNHRWHGAGTSNSYPLTTNDQEVIKPSSFYVEDGSYFRIRNIQIGYTINSELLSAAKIEKLRLYANVQNPWTTFKYKGFSPELNNSSADLTDAEHKLQAGIDNNIYPLTAIYTFGVSLTF